MKTCFYPKIIAVGLKTKEIIMCHICESIEEKHFSDPKEGDLRLWWIPQFGMDKSFRYPIKSVAEAKHMLDAFAMYDMFQLEHRIKPDFSNCGGLEVFESGEWCDWQNDDGYEIDDVDENGIANR